MKAISLIVTGFLLGIAATPAAAAQSGLIVSHHEELRNFSFHGTALSSQLPADSASSAVAPTVLRFDALGRSWSLVRGNRLWLFWYFVVTRIFELLGFCCCFFPGLLTAPLVYVADYEAYIRLVRGTEGWWIEDPSRPPESPFDDPTGPAVVTPVA